MTFTIDKKKPFRNCLNPKCKERTNKDSGFCSFYCESKKKFDDMIAKL